jgi:uncharacterized protein
MSLTMLLGLLAGRRRWVQRIPELMPQVRRLMWVALAVGLLCGAAFTLVFDFNRVPGPSPIKLFGGLCYWTSRLAMTIFFAIQVPWSLWWLKRHERGPLEALWARLTYGPRAASPLAATS